MKKREKFGMLFKKDPPASVGLIVAVTEKKEGS